MTNKIPAILGGKKLRKIPLEYRTTIGPEEKKAVIEVMDSDVLSAFIGAPGEKFLGGDKVLEFENSWKKKYGFKQNRGDKTFLKKWGISIKFFKKYYLQSKTKYMGPLTEPKITLNYLFELILCKIRRIFIF